MQFEALLALTNLISTGDSVQDKFETEKGVSAVHYQMFSDNLLVRRAATEVFCNMPQHEALLKYLRQPDKLRLWLAFCEDWNNETDPAECFKTACASSGTLAVAVSDEQTMRAVIAENGVSSVVALLDSHRDELVHRALVMLENMLAHEGALQCEVAEHLVNGGIVPALSTIISSSTSSSSLAPLAREIAVQLSTAMKRVVDAQNG